MAAFRRVAWYFQNFHFKIEVSPISN